MKEFIASKGPLSIFKHKWIARAFTKDIAKGIPMKTDNWLDDMINNPPKLNLVYTLREYQPYEEEFLKEQYKFLGPSIYERKADVFSVLLDTEMKDNLAKVQKWISQALGNSGGAEMIINYYKNM